MRTNFIKAAKITLSIIATALSLGMQAYAQEQAQEPGGASLPAASTDSMAGESGETATFSQKRHGRGHRGHKAQSRWEQVRSLQSLTAEQGKQIDEIFQSYKKDLKPIKQEARALKQKLASKDTTGDAAQETQSKLTDLKKDLKTKNNLAWTKVKSILTEKQLGELQNQSGKKTEASRTRS